MKYSDLPTFVRESSVFDQHDIDILLQANKIPSDEEIDTIRDEPQIYDLLNAFIGDESSRSTNLQIYAKNLLEKGDFNKAWKVILL